MNSVRVGTCRITGINSCPWCTGGLSQRFRISPRDDIHIIGPGYISAATGRTASTGHGANADSIAAVTTGSPLAANNNAGNAVGDHLDRAM